MPLNSPTCKGKEKVVNPGEHCAGEEKKGRSTLPFVFLTDLFTRNMIKYLPWTELPNFS